MSNKQILYPGTIITESALFLWHLIKVSFDHNKANWQALADFYKITKPAARSRWYRLDQKLQEASGPHGDKLITKDEDVVDSTLFFWRLIKISFDLRQIKWGELGKFYGSNAQSTSMRWHHLDAKIQRQLGKSSHDLVGEASSRRKERHKAPKSRGPTRGSGGENAYHISDGYPVNDRDSRQLPELNSTPQSLGSNSLTPEVTKMVKRGEDQFRRFDIGLMQQAPNKFISIPPDLLIAINTVSYAKLRDLVKAIYIMCDSSRYTITDLLLDEEEIAEEEKEEVEEEKKEEEEEEKEERESRASLARESRGKLPVHQKLTSQNTRTLIVPDLTPEPKPELEPKLNPPSDSLIELFASPNWNKWPESLRRFIRKPLFRNSLANISQEAQEMKLKEIVNGAVERGTVWTIDWDQHESPCIRILKEEYPGLEQRISTSYLNRKRKERGTESSEGQDKPDTLINKKAQKIHCTRKESASRGKELASQTHRASDPPHTTKGPVRASSRYSDAEIDRLENAQSVMDFPPSFRIYVTRCLSKNNMEKDISKEDIWKKLRQTAVETAKNETLETTNWETRELVHKFIRREKRRELLEHPTYLDRKNEVNISTVSVIDLAGSDSDSDSDSEPEPEPEPGPELEVASEFILDPPSDDNYSPIERKILEKHSSNKNLYKKAFHIIRTKDYFCDQKNSPGLTELKTELGMSHLPDSNKKAAQEENCIVTAIYPGCSYSEGGEVLNELIAENYFGSYLRYGDDMDSQLQSSQSPSSSEAEPYDSSEAYWLSQQQFHDLTTTGEDTDSDEEDLDSDEEEEVVEEEDDSDEDDDDDDSDEEEDQIPRYRQGTYSNPISISATPATTAINQRHEGLLYNAW
ncbi:MAG: hypothetical protein M1834_006608 [Cirrosporium novae-zelandiae]|nr:MAG: hypothetical protein M1834_006608 [Cirrosporium novae-zelandiae]